MRYQISVKREIQVWVEIEADSEEEAIDRYKNGEADSEEDIVDSSDTEEPTAVLIK